jgi:hypothetical protein
MDFWLLAYSYIARGTDGPDLKKIFGDLRTSTNGLCPKSEQNLCPTLQRIPDRALRAALHPATARLLLHGRSSAFFARLSPGASATRAATGFCRCWSHCSGSSSRRSVSCKMRQVVPARAFLGGGGVLQPNHFVSLLTAPAWTAPLQRPPPLPTACGAHGRAGPRRGRHSPLRIRRRTGEEAGGGRRQSRGAEELHGRRARGSAVRVNYTVNRPVSGKEKTGRVYWWNRPVH